MPRFTPPTPAAAGPSRRNNKTLAPGEGPFGLRWSVALLAPVPPHSSVLPPGAGNEVQKALNADHERAKKGEKGYLERTVLDRDVHAPTIGRHDDGDGAAVRSVQGAHGSRSLRAGSPMRNPLYSFKCFQADARPIRGSRSGRPIRASLVHAAQFPPSGVALVRPRQDAGERNATAPSIPADSVFAGHKSNSPRPNL